jgi:hypothetical protein
MKPDELLTFAEAARELPNRPHISTLHRWRLKGVRGVRLSTQLIGGRRYVSRHALVEFCAATIAAGNAGVPQQPISRQREAAILRAEEDLDELGA